jgi:hypothetical protein
MLCTFNQPIQSLSHEADVILRSLMPAGVRTGSIAKEQPHCMFKWVDGQTASPWTIETIHHHIAVSMAHVEAIDMSGSSAAASLKQTPEEKCLAEYKQILGPVQMEFVSDENGDAFLKTHSFNAEYSSGEKSSYGADQNTKMALGTGHSASGQGAEETTANEKLVVLCTIGRGNRNNTEICLAFHSFPITSAAAAKSICGALIVDREVSCGCLSMG